MAKHRGEFGPWNLSDALDLIREIQPLIREVNYHITLGGGVLNEGMSEKDLDLFIIPLNGYESNAGAVMEVLNNVFGSYGRSLRDSPDYGPDSFPHAKEMKMFDYPGKRIDIFVQ